MVNWDTVAALGTVGASVFGGVVHFVSKVRAEGNAKLDAIGEHLRRQDEDKDRFREEVTTQHRELGERVARLEGPLGIAPRAKALD